MHGSIPPSVRTVLKEDRDKVAYCSTIRIKLNRVDTASIPLLPSLDVAVKTLYTSLQYCIPSSQHRVYLTFCKNSIYIIHKERAFPYAGVSRKGFLGVDVGFE
jgi:hypothetical protein